jgi:hypothetical protein
VVMLRRGNRIFHVGQVARDAAAIVRRPSVRGGDRRGQKDDKQRRAAVLGKSTAAGMALATGKDPILQAIYAAFWPSSSPSFEEND